MSQRRSKSAPTKLRDRLLADAQSLANHGLVHSGRLKDCKQVPGYRPMASDIMMLSTVFKEKWASIEGKTPTTLAQINDAASKAMQLFSAVGLRDQNPSSLAMPPWYPAPAPPPFTPDAGVAAAPSPGAHARAQTRRRTRRCRFRAIDVLRHRQQGGLAHHQPLERMSHARRGAGYRRAAKSESDR